MGDVTANNEGPRTDPAGRAWDQLIREYYEECDSDYRWLWHLNRCYAMHYGVWDDTVDTLPAALVRQNQVMAQAAGIRRNERVLDAGCGIGGSAFYLAGTCKASVTGISLSPGQISRARKIAQAEGLDARVDFHVRDYTNTALPDQAFDVVWAIESVCHAPRKVDFVREAYRLLRPGGRLILMDGFAHARGDAADEALMRSWLDGWAVPGLATLAEFQRDLDGAGFAGVTYRDFTRAILPSARRLHRYAAPALWLDGIARRIGLRTKIQSANVRAARDQFRALEKSLWHYGQILAIKPKN